VKIHVTPSLEVLDIDSITMGKNIDARRGQGLMEEVFGVFLEPSVGLGIDVLARPILAPRRDVQIPLGPEMG
jgi:hypothetical protein